MTEEEQLLSGAQALLEHVPGTRSPAILRVLQVILLLLSRLVRRQANLEAALQRRCSDVARPAKEPVEAVPAARKKSHAVPKARKVVLGNTSDGSTATIGFP